MQKVLASLPDLTSEMLDVIYMYAKTNPDEKIPKRLFDYLFDNKDEILADLGNDVFVSFLEQTGAGLMKFGGWIVVLEGITGPAGANSFVLVNQYGAGISILKYGKGVSRAGKYLGAGFMATGFGLGMYDDMNNGKTFGQATAHNGGSLAVGMGGGALAGSIATTVFGVSNPV